MADDLKQTGKPDDARINVNQPHEVQYWCKQLDCNEHDLRGAVQAVGPMVKDVQKRLDKHE
jgi:hypothetical protein